MVGVLQSVYDRKTGKCLSREIVEILDMTDEEYYAPLVKILSEDLLNKLAVPLHQLQV
ncbi:hypothetical protein [Clostridium chromiireducens]|uniref:hypothetical protein n=1 Tax=Clostridium chromiireducens TaxID=225345 RepID=UPI0019220820|nr:hypothetical protein [Clostridium chromiireducens]